MRRIAGLIAISAVLVSFGPVEAKDDKFGSVLDVLSGVLGGRTESRVTGHVVHVRDNTVILMAADGQTYSVDVAALDSSAREALTPGQAVTIGAKPGAKSFHLVASDVRRDDRSGAAKSFKNVHGVVQTSTASTVTFRTDEGRLLSFDASQMKGAQPQLKAGDAMTVVYEESTQRKRIARWFEADQATAVAPDPNDLVRLHGHVLSAADTALVLRADDGWTHVVDLTQVSADARKFEIGQGVTITAKPGDSVLAATEVLRDTADPARRGQATSRKFQTVHGSVQSVSGSTLTFRTDAGRLMPVDISQIKGYRPMAKTGDPVTLVYEPGAKGKLAALWLQPDQIQPAAAVGSAPRERVRGQIDSIDGAKFWLKTDDDRWFLVDTAQLDPAVRKNVQPGRQVSVVGRLTDPSSNQLIADRMRVE